MSSKLFVLFAVSLSSFLWASQCGETVGSSGESYRPESTFAGASTDDSKTWLDFLPAEADSPITWSAEISTALRKHLTDSEKFLGGVEFENHQGMLDAIQCFRKEYPEWRNQIITSFARFSRTSREGGTPGTTDRYAFFKFIFRLIDSQFPSLEKLDFWMANQNPNNRHWPGLKTLEEIARPTNPMQERQRLRFLRQNLGLFRERLTNVFIGMHRRGFSYASITPFFYDGLLARRFSTTSDYLPGTGNRRQIIFGLGRSNIRAIAIKDEKAVELVFVRTWEGGNERHNQETEKNLLKIRNTISQMHALATHIKFQALVFVLVPWKDSIEEVQSRLQPLTSDHLQIHVMHEKVPASR